MDRYVRHTVMPWFGRSGQEKLRGSSILIVGCGGLGCVCSSFLARAGAGLLRIVDPDVVSVTDLHRQILYTEEDAAASRPKVNVVAERLAAANRDVRVDARAQQLDSRSAAGLLEGIDVLIDCTDNFEARMLINDVCLEYNRPWIHGACVGTTGIVIPFLGGGTACYRCVLDHIPAPGSAPTCQEAGILGPVAGVTGCLEAAEAIRLLVNPALVLQRIIYFESVSYTYETIDIKRKPDCPACVGGDYRFLDQGK